MDVNWYAFAAAVVAQILIGYIWFHPAVMGKIWAKAIGKTIEEIKPQNPALVYGVTILLTLLFTNWLVYNVTGPGQDHDETHSFVTAQHGLAHAILLTLMFTIPIFGTLALFERKTWGWFIVQTGYWFLRLAAAASILSAWR
jgi:cytochrome b561